MHLPILYILQSNLVSIAKTNHVSSCGVLAATPTTPCEAAPPVVTAAGEAAWPGAAATVSMSSDARVAECPLCLAELPTDYFPRLATCAHRSCFDCFQQYLRIEISESRISVACPECSEPMHPNGKFYPLFLCKVVDECSGAFNKQSFLAS